MYNAYLSIKATMNNGYSDSFVKHFAKSLTTRGCHITDTISVFYFVEGCIIVDGLNIQIFYAEDGQDG